MLIEGTLIKGYGGFYYVFAEGRVRECTLRGRFRVQKQDFIAGDKVLILPGAGDKATIEKVLERKNFLTRPPVANVDQAVLVFSLTTPDPDYNLLDRLLIQAEYAGVDILIVFTKLDLVRRHDMSMGNYYQDRGYVVRYVSNKTGEGITDLAGCFSDNVSLLAGPSGSGKSSLINSLEPGKNLRTGEVSSKIGRGRHTTRHVELIPVAGGLVADTPGFSSLYLPEIKKEELQNYFPELLDYRLDCRFKSCLHDKEPDCAVKEAVREGKIFDSRYKHYLQFLGEIAERERRY